MSAARYDNGAAFCSMTQDVERLIRALDPVDYGRIDWHNVSTGDHIVIEVGTGPLGAALEANPGGEA